MIEKERNLDTTALQEIQRIKERYGNEKPDEAKLDDLSPSSAMIAFKRLIEAVRAIQKLLKYIEHDPL